MPRSLWIDCDPGHDDAFAILLASYSPEVSVIGISIVHGNDTVEHCALNAKRFMWACGVKDIPVYRGVNRPFVRDAKHCPEIHGTPGAQGVAGMCGFHFPDGAIFSDPKNLPNEGHGVLKMAETILRHPEKVTIVATGAHTNVAMAIRLFPEMKNNVEKIVFMGGAIGLGNTGVAAEFNIEIDPEAAHVVFHSGIPLVMIPLEVTHSVLVTPEILHKITTIDEFKSSKGKSAIRLLEDRKHPHVEYNEIFNRIADIGEKNQALQDQELGSIEQCTAFSKCCVQLLSFFKSTYKNVFSFDSPPLHDPCAVYYCIQPDAFKTMNVFLDVELAGDKCLGRTLCDLHGIKKRTPNATLCHRVDVDRFWDKMLSCLKVSNERSPLN